jgi:2-polyprenyl-3-methyl-5-hydroxy-6-metoxy-1,4-benzoquinol methylase
VLRQLRAINTPLDQPLKGIDIGCGTGILREQIEAATKWTIDGFDLNLSALSRTRPGRGGTFYYNVFDERPEFLGAYDVAFLFDVIEHIEPTAPFLQAVIRYLKPGGYLFINVPALELIRSKYDDAVGHYRRYNKPTLRAEVERFGMVVDDIRYWACSMVPLLLARRIYVSGAKSTDTAATVRSGFKPPGALIHSVLRSIMRVESTLVGRPPWGTSLLMAARKP